MQDMKPQAAALTDSPSGFRQLVGYRVTEWSEGSASIALTIGPRHLNRSGLVHGGVIATLIDTAGGYAGCFCPHAGRVRRNVTMSMSTQFVAPARSGTLTARAKLRGGGKRVFVCSIDVVDDQGALIATGEAAYRYRTGSESPQGVALEPPKEKRETQLG